MVISRPTKRTITSFILFLIVAYALVGMSIIQIYNDNNPPWYAYLSLSALGPIALFITFRMIFGYKVLRFGDNKIEILYPVTIRKMLFSIDQVSYWRESTVKTGKSSTYRELEIKFDNGKKLQIGEQEYSNYKPIISYLQKKLQRKRS